MRPKIYIQCVISVVSRIEGVIMKRKCYKQQQNLHEMQLSVD